jgi:rubrerythrin
MTAIKRLTPSEITNLWNSYLTNTMAFHVSKYFIAKTQDEELHAILEYAEEIAKIEVDKSKEFLEEDNQPLPQKFDENDVDLNAPAICTDNFTAIIKYQLAQAAHIVYSLSLSTSTRKDIRQFFQECLKNSAELYNRLADFIVKKGLHHPEVHIPTPNQAEKVSNQRFLAGWFAERRPINTAEISQLVFNFKATELHKTFMKSFAQVTPSKQLKKHFERGVEILQKHLDIFQSILTENDLPKLPTWESELTDTTVSPFSDRLMLYKMTLLASEASGRYGTSLSTVQRRDLGVHYTRLIAEILKYGEDSANLMIEHGFMDQLPLAKNK